MNDLATIQRQNNAVARMRERQAHNSKGCKLCDDIKRHRTLKPKNRVVRLQGRETTIQ